MHVLAVRSQLAHPLGQPAFATMQNPPVHVRVASQSAWVVQASMSDG
jgi:hypothetical protein